VDSCNFIVSRAWRARSSSPIGFPNSVVGVGSAAVELAGSGSLELVSADFHWLVDNCRVVVHIHCFAAEGSAAFQSFDFGIVVPVAGSNLVQNYVAADYSPAVCTAAVRILGQDVLDLEVVLWAVMEYKFHSIRLVHGCCTQIGGDQDCDSNDMKLQLWLVVGDFYPFWWMAEAQSWQQLALVQSRQKKSFPSPHVLG